MSIGRMVSTEYADFAPNIETIRYEMERFQAQVYFSESVLRTLEVEQFRDHQMGALAWRLMGIVALWREQRVLKVPANWWQHFKQRWFPAWALKRWPVLYTWYDAGVVLPKVPVVEAKYNSVEFPVWRERSDAD